MVQGYRISTEREIAQGAWLGGKAGIAGKRPDVVIRNGSRVWLVEVERSRKNAKEYAALLSWLAILYTCLIQSHARAPSVKSGGIANSV